MLLLVFGGGLLAVFSVIWRGLLVVVLKMNAEERVEGGKKKEEEEEELNVPQTHLPELVGEGLVEQSSQEDISIFDHFKKGNVREVSVETLKEEYNKRVEEMRSMLPVIRRSAAHEVTIQSDGCYQLFSGERFYTQPEARYA